MPALAAILIAVVLASPFGTATATAIDDTDGLTVEVTVEFTETAVAVIARPFSDFEELPATALVTRPDGTWIGWVKLPTAQNWQIAFEAFEPGGVVSLSESSTLLELGVDPVVIVSDVEGPLPDKPLIPTGSLWLIVGVISMVAALVALAFWTFGSWGDADADREDASGETVEEESADSTNGRD